MLFRKILQIPPPSDLTCHTAGEEQSIHTRIQGDAATYPTVAWVEDDQFQVACYSPLPIPEGSRRDIAEAWVRDLEDGELRFQVAKITDGEAVIDRMIATAVRMLDVYLPALLSVVYGNEEPGEAIRRVEGGRGCGHDRGDE